MTQVPLPGALWLVGCGNMAGAMLAGWLAQGVGPAYFTVIRPSGAPAAEGVRVLTAPPEGEVPALALLGVKPHKLDEVAAVLAPRLAPETVVVSILAGVEVASLRARFPHPAAIVRAMPNLPVRFGRGVVSLYSEDRQSAAAASVAAMMARLGRVEWFDEEELFQAAGILTGAGPAFLFRFIDALAAAAEELGLPKDQAARLAVAMVEGAGAQAASSDETPAELARQVASPGGTTEAGLAVLDTGEALASLISRTLTAARNRSREMAFEARRTPS